MKNLQSLKDGAKIEAILESDECFVLIKAVSRVNVG